MAALTFIQILSIITVSMVIGTFVSITFFVTSIADLKNQIVILNKEVTTLKTEIVDLKDQLLQSKVIIAEQAENITQTAK